VTRWMIDIETLATASNAYVCALAIVDSDNPEVQYWTQVLGDQPGAAIDHHTMRWWVKQGEAAHRYVFNRKDADGNLNPRVKYFDLALDKLDEMITEDDEVWAKPPSFDITVLESHYKSRRLGSPWNHRNIRDLRTVIEEAKKYGYIEPEMEGTKHHPLHDTLHQARVLRQLRPLNDQ